MWYLVLSRTLQQHEPTDPVFKAHVDWLDDNHRAGKILFFGPSSDRAFGIYVVLADSTEAAKAFAGQGIRFTLNGHRRAAGSTGRDIRRALRPRAVIPRFEAAARVVRPADQAAAPLASWRLRASPEHRQPGFPVWLFPRLPIQYSEAG